MGKCAFCGLEQVELGLFDYKNETEYSFCSPNCLFQFLVKNMLQSLNMRMPSNRGLFSRLEAIAREEFGWTSVP